MWWLLTVLGYGVVLPLMALLVAYTYYMSKDHWVLRKLGLKGPTPWPIVGTLVKEFDLGLFNYHVGAYRKYAGEKVYTGYLGKNPCIYIRDLDIIRDVCVKHFNLFANRNKFLTEEPLDHAMTNLDDDHWKRVRNIVSPTFSSGKIKRMAPLIQRSTDLLLNYLKEKRESGQEVELKDALSRFTMNCIASTGFGVEVNTFSEEGNRFALEGKRMMEGANKSGFISLFFGFLWPVIKRVTNFVPMESFRYFQTFVDQTIAERDEAVATGGHSNRVDFLQLMMEARDEHEKDGKGGEKIGSSPGDSEHSKKSLTYLDIQGQAILFLFAGYDTMSSVMSFTTFLLAMYPGCCEAAQKEIDDVLQGDRPDFDNIQSLMYLDMCVNEAMRLFPPGFVINRVCSKEIEINGVRFPEKSVVFFSVCGIHRDPDIYPDPEKFIPERFTVEEKAKRHPYAHLPFGAGPRNCMGMRLAMLIVKVGIASLLQENTPTKCDKSVYPIDLNKLQLEAKDGLWVEMRPRK